MDTTATSAAAWNLAGRLADEMPDGTFADFREALRHQPLTLAAEAIVLLADRFDLR